MKIIKIQGNENKHVQYLFNRVMPIANRYGAGGKYEMPSGNVTIKVCSNKTLEKAKELLNELKIKFLESEE